MKILKPTYNILLVDDESIIREQVALLVRDISKDFNIFHASNGIEAIEIICSTQIDIILTDIKMPICDGIEMLERLADLGYKGQTVVISGFDDYNFVRQAMKLGAVDYIMKPIDLNEFHAILNDCISKIENYAQMNSFYSSHKVKESLELLFAQQGMVAQLIDNPAAHEELFKHNNLTQYKYATVIVMDVLSPGHISDAEKQVIFLELQTAFQGYFTNGATLIQGELDRIWVAIILATDAKYADKMDAFSQYLLAKEIRFGISNDNFPISQISIAYDNAVSSLENFFYDLPVGDVLDEIYPYETTMDSLVTDICNCDFDAFSQRLSTLFSTICYQKIKVEDTRELLSNIVYDLMKRNSEYISIIGKYTFSANDVNHVIQESLCASQMRKNMISIFGLYIRDFCDKKQDNDEYTIQKAKQYIQSGYRENLTLVDVSKKLGLHPNYLSTFFKDKTGTTFSEHLRSVRINKAKELMQTTNMMLYEIAHSVGYNDYAQFYRAFKKVTGVSPSEYQKNINIL